MSEAVLNPELFEALAVELGEDQFDLMLAGDGSGTTILNHCGWACTSYLRASGATKVHFGGASGGTNNQAELLPYLHVLGLFHEAWKEHGRKSLSEKPTLRVLIVTDSELTARCGDGTYQRRANLHLWAGIDWLVAEGYRVRWRHVPRNSNGLSALADGVAGSARKKMKEVA